MSFQKKTGIILAALGVAIILWSVSQTNDRADFYVGQAVIRSIVFMLLMILFFSLSKPLHKFPNLFIIGLSVFFSGSFAAYSIYSETVQLNRITELADSLRNGEPITSTDASDELVSFLEDHAIRVMNVSEEYQAQVDSSLYLQAYKPQTFIERTLLLEVIDSIKELHAAVDTYEKGREDAFLHLKQRVNESSNQSIHRAYSWYLNADMRVEAERIQELYVENQRHLWIELEKMVVMTLPISDQLVLDGEYVKFPDQISEEQFNTQFNIVRELLREEEEIFENQTLLRDQALSQYVD